MTLLRRITRSKLRSHLSQHILRIRNSITTLTTAKAATHSRQIRRLTNPTLNSHTQKDHPKHNNLTSRHNLSLKHKLTSHQLNNHPKLNSKPKRRSTKLLNQHRHNTAQRRHRHNNRHRHNRPIQRTTQPNTNHITNVQDPTQ